MGAADGRVIIFDPFHRRSSGCTVLYRAFIIPLDLAEHGAIVVTVVQGCFFPTERLFDWFRLRSGVKPRAKNYTSSGAELRMSREEDGPRSRVIPHTHRSCLTLQPSCVFL